MVAADTPAPDSKASWETATEPSRMHKETPSDTSKRGETSFKALSSACCASLCTWKPAVCPKCFPAGCFNISSSKPCDCECWQSRMERMEMHGEFVMKPLVQQLPVLSVHDFDNMFGDLEGFDDDDDLAVDTPPTSAGVPSSTAEDHQDFAPVPFDPRRPPAASNALNNWARRAWCTDEDPLAPEELMNSISGPRIHVRSRASQPSEGSRCAIEMEQEREYSRPSWFDADAGHLQPRQPVPREQHLRRGVPAQLRTPLSARNSGNALSTCVAASSPVDPRERENGGSIDGQVAIESGLGGEPVYSTPEKDDPLVRRPLVRRLEFAVTSSTPDKVEAARLGPRVAVRVVPKPCQRAGKEFDDDDGGVPADNSKQETCT